MSRPALYLIDGYALIYRSYFAFAKNPLRASTGEETGAAYGMANFLVRLLDERKPDYLAVVQQADLVLDSPGFSGGGTSLDALGVATPALAFDGCFARGRQTAAMLRLLDLPQLIASDADDYVEKAVALLSDAPERERLRDHLRAHGERLFANPAVVPALEAFLLAATDMAATSCP